MRLLVRYETLGGHVHTGWWSNGGKNGTLVFTVDEWAVLHSLLDDPAYGAPDLHVTLEEKS